jgi:hypothetical protein
LRSHEYTLITWERKNAKWENSQKIELILLSRSSVLALIFQNISRKHSNIVILGDELNLVRSLNKFIGIRNILG